MSFYTPPGLQEHNPGGIGYEPPDNNPYREYTPDGLQYGGPAGNRASRRDPGPTRDPRLDGLLDAAQGRSESGHELYGPSNEYVSNTLNGQPGNWYMDDTYRAYSDWSNPDLQRYTDFLYGQLGSGGGQGGFSYSGAGGGGGGSAFTPRYQDEIEAILGGKYLDEGNPYRDEMIDRISSRIRDEFQEGVIPGINDEFEGLGRTGGRAWSNARADATREFGESLGDTVAGIEYTDYNNRMGDVMTALGMGNSFDIAGLDANSRENAARISASASRANARSSLEAQNYAATLGFLRDATGMSVGMDEASLSGRAGMADLFSQDQRFALGMVPDLTGQDIRDREAAINPHLALAGLENERYLGNRGFDLQRELGYLDSADRRYSADRGVEQARIGSRPANRAIDFDLWRYGEEAPWRNLERYSGILDALSGGYFDDRTWGYDSANSSGSGFSGALSGGLAGAGLVSQFGGG